MRDAKPDEFWALHGVRVAKPDEFWPLHGVRVVKPGEFWGLHGVRVVKPGEFWVLHGVQVVKPGEFGALHGMRVAKPVEFGALHGVRVVKPGEFGALHGVQVVKPGEFGALHGVREAKPGEFGALHGVQVVKPGEFGALHGVRVVKPGEFGALHGVRVVKPGEFGALHGVRVVKPGEFRGLHGVQVPSATFGPSVVFLRLLNPNKKEMRNNEQLNPTVARSVWQDFLLFLKDPHAAGATIYRWGTLGLFAVLLLLTYLCMLLKWWITPEPVIDASNLVALTPEKLLRYILLIPLVEELGFRGFLLFHKKKYVVIAALIILHLLSLLGESWYGELPWLRYSLMLLVALWLGSMLVNRKARDWTLGLIGRHKRVLIYASSIAFGCLHLMNQDHFAVINLLPIVPKVVFGLFGAYVTVRSNSIVPSWLFHAANNSVVSLILYVYSLSL